MASGFPDWLRAFTMVGKHGDDYKVVLVDGEGNLYALLQGMTPDDELQTVRLDDKGRISAFVIDSIDAWGNMLSIGNAELAARLGSPDRYDRRGQVREICTFGNGLANVILDNDELGTTSALTPVISLFGGYSLEITLAASTDAWSLIEFSVPADIAPAHGLEVAFATESTDIEVEIRVDRWTGTQVQRMGVTFDAKAKELRIRGRDDEPHTFAEGVEIQPGASMFHMMKVVADLAGGAYYRFLFNGESYPVSDYGPYCHGAVTMPYTHCRVYVRNNIAAARMVHVDNMILTVAEPE